MGIKQKLGQRIREAREQGGHTQQVLADVLGVSRAVISEWENGKTSPNLDRIDLIADFLRKPVSFFFTEPTEMQGHSVSNPAFYIRAYNRLVESLNEKKFECERQAIGYECLIAHFAASASLLFNELAEEEREKIRQDSADTWMTHLQGQRALPQGQQIALALRDPDSNPDPTALLRSLEFASINGFERIIKDAHSQSGIIQRDALMLQLLESFNGASKRKLGALWPEASAKASIDEIPHTAATLKRVREAYRFFGTLRKELENKVEKRQRLEHCEKLLRSALFLTDQAEHLEYDEQDTEGKVGFEASRIGDVDSKKYTDLQTIVSYLDRVLEQVRVLNDLPPNHPDFPPADDNMSIDDIPF